MLTRQGKYWRSIGSSKVKKKVKIDPFNARIAKVEVEAQMWSIIHVLVAQG